MVEDLVRVERHRDNLKNNGSQMESEKKLLTFFITPVGKKVIGLTGMDQRGGRPAGRAF
jgi:hypothetical protein